MRIYFKQEMKYHYDRSKPLDDFPAYLIAMGEHAGYTFYVKNLNGRHPTAYICVPEGHPLYGKCLTDEIPLKVHGGVTYAEGRLYHAEGSGWYIGWDYGHAGDYAAYYEEGSYLYENSKRWTVDEIIDECVSACEQLEEMEK
jgi:hypothetical protein